MLLTRFRCGVPLPFLICMIVVPVFGQAADETNAALLPEILAPLTTTVDYRLKISGEIVRHRRAGHSDFR